MFVWVAMQALKYIWSHKMVSWGIQEYFLVRIRPSGLTSQRLSLWLWSRTTVWELACLTLGRLTTFGIRSVSLYAWEVKGGMALCSLVWEAETMAKWNCGNVGCDVTPMRTGLFKREKSVVHVKTLRPDIWTFDLMVMTWVYNRKRSWVRDLGSHNTFMLLHTGAKPSSSILCQCKAVFMGSNILIITKWILVKINNLVRGEIVMTDI